jgi:hypothetical protein
VCILRVTEFDPPKMEEVRAYKVVLVRDGQRIFTPFRYTELTLDAWMVDHGTAWDGYPLGFHVFESWNGAKAAWEVVKMQADDTERVKIIPVIVGRRNSPAHRLEMATLRNLLQQWARIRPDCAGRSCTRLRNFVPRPSIPRYGNRIPSVQESET